MGTITHGWPSHLPIIHYIHYFTTNTAFCQTRIRTWSWILKYIFLTSCMLLSICYWFYSPLHSRTTRTWRVLPSLRHPSAQPQVMPISSIGPNGAISGECNVLWLTGAGCWGGIMVMEWWTRYTLCSELRPARHGWHDRGDSPRAVNGTS